MMKTKEWKDLNCKSIYKKILTTLIIAIVGISSTITSGFANIEDRGLGEVVVIAGEQRPDLTDHFDFLKQNTVMIKGLVFAKDRNGNIIVPKEMEQEIQSDKEQKEQIAEEREKIIIKNSMGPVCNRCDKCGQLQCTTRTCLLCNGQFCPGPAGGPYEGCPCYK